MGRFLLACLLALAAACSAGGAAPTLTPSPAPAATAFPTRVSSGGATPGATYTPSGDPLAAGQLRLEFVPNTTQARYRIGVQILNEKDPSEATAATNAVSGTVVIGLDGSVISTTSMITVDLTTLKSDNAPMDLYVQSLVLQTRLYPKATFVPTGTTGLESPPPTSGPMSFEILGSLTVHGVTRPAIWTVFADAGNGTQLTGTAETSFAFEDYKLTPPRVPVVVRLDNKITLELDFTLRIAQ